ncbi:hypothetical protein DSO57_1021248 [Entomophthora muscae]|uniref:Uncharacterized protein n=1 Tax=Entomophthora muscae TaxID=34485 RepID=A0ACC2UPM9_9FUNG|nr:hypothetical protein DSO57_1021248 [Entomophthora muscae]
MEMSLISCFLVLVSLAAALPEASLAKGCTYEYPYCTVYFKPGYEALAHLHKVEKNIQSNCKMCRKAYNKRCNPNPVKFDFHNRTITTNIPHEAYAEYIETKEHTPFMDNVSCVL